ncbi:MAG: hypothetical protein ABIJ18_05465 [archaeon]
MTIPEESGLHLPDNVMALDSPNIPSKNKPFFKKIFGFFIKE